MNYCHEPGLALELACLLMPLLIGACAYLARRASRRGRPTIASVVSLVAAFIGTAYWYYRAGLHPAGFVVPWVFLGGAGATLASAGVAARERNLDRAFALVPTSLVIGTPGVVVLLAGLCDP
jgi:hypothetical protein